MSIIQTIENQLTCCITFDTLKNPMTTQNGFTYQKNAIHKWLKKSNKQPLTGQRLKTQILTKNHIIQKAINNYQSMKIIVSSNYYQIEYLKAQCALIDNLIQDLIEKKYNLTSNKQQIIKNQMQLKKLFKQKQTIKKQNLIKSLIIIIINESKAFQFLSLILKNYSLQQIESSSDIFFNLPRQQQIQTSILWNNIQLQQQSYQIVLYNKSVDFVQFAKATFQSVQYLYFGSLKINPQQLNLFLQNINKIFPRLKIFKIAGCGFTDLHWKVIIKNIQYLTNIQGLSIRQHKIYNVTELDLQAISTINKLKCFFIYNDTANYSFQDTLSNQSKKVLNEFKQNNKHVKMMF